MLLLLLALPGPALHAQTRWTWLASDRWQLPRPAAAPEPTASLALDVDNDGVSDMIVGSRLYGPAVAWYRRLSNHRWETYVIEDSVMPVEAGGAFADIDGDGDQDIVFGGDARSNEIWWWENPYPDYAPQRPWKRRTIKRTGANAHHDQMFFDADGDGRLELISWNQGAKRLLLFRIPPEPRRSDQWPSTEIYGWKEGDPHEGLAAADINLDGKADIVGAGRWFEHVGGDQFQPHLIDDRYRFSRAVAGNFIKGGHPEVVFGPGDNLLPLRMYVYDGKQWTGRDLLPQPVDHGHTLQAGDIDLDGNLDLLCAEMAQWSTRPDNRDAKVWVLHGDGRGGFKPQLVHRGLGMHEGRLADLDGDGRLDIFAKPFRFRAPRLDVFLNDPEGRVAAVSPVEGMDPSIEIWHGEDYDFGAMGTPQQWVNLLGRVRDRYGIGLLTVSLNGSEPEVLTVGPDAWRLAGEGDFTVEFEIAKLREGENTAEIVATNLLQRQSRRTVRFHYRGGRTWPLPFSASFARMRLQAAPVQVVDGRWRSDETGIRPVEPGYDRLLAVGDRTWKDYDARVRFTLHGFDKAGYYPIAYGPGLGVLLRFQGHRDWGGLQPRHGWWPMGALAMYYWCCSPAVTPVKDQRMIFMGNAAQILWADESARKLEFGVPYFIRVRAESRPNQLSLYSQKVWRASDPEPEIWDSVAGGAARELAAGSLLLVANYADVTFHDISVVPLEGKHAR